MFEILRQLISVGGYRLDDMLLRIDTMYASGVDARQRPVVDPPRAHAPDALTVPVSEGRLA